MRAVIGGMAAVILIVLLASFGCSGTTIQPGYVGIVVNQWGTNRGVQDLTLKTGRIYYNPWSEQVIEYPTFMQTVSWTASTHEGNPYDESITFTTDKGTKVNADISLSYQLAEAAVPAFYTTFRHGDIKDFTYGYMHNVARDVMNEIGGHYTVEQVMGDNEEFLHVVRDTIQTRLKPFGITISQFGFIGAPRPPQSVVDSINNMTQAKFLAIQKENELKQSQADAAKRIAAAEGEAKANEILSRSLTPAVVTWQQLVLQKQQLDVQDRWINRWNGTMPTVTAGNGGNMLYTLPAPTKPN